jgi:hypothetical protein
MATDQIPTTVGALEARVRKSTDNIARLRAVMSHVAAQAQATQPPKPAEGVK